MSEACKHEPFEHVVSMTDIEGRKKSYAYPVLFTMDILSQT